MSTTRTIIAVIDDLDYIDDGATPERIVEVTTAAAELFYANRDDVQEFRVIERRESYRHVNLPADYNAMEDREVRAMAWHYHCTGRCTMTTQPRKRGRPRTKPAGEVHVSVPIPQWVLEHIDAIGPNRGRTVARLFMQQLARTTHTDGLSRKLGEILYG